MVKLFIDYLICPFHVSGFFAALTLELLKNRPSRASNSFVRFYIVADGSNWRTTSSFPLRWQRLVLSSSDFVRQKQVVTATLDLLAIKQSEDILLMISQ